MRAAFIQHHKEKFEIRTVPIPEPQDGEILVRIHSCGCCHTDIHAIDGDWLCKSILPLCPGHEGAGKVAKLGRGVTSWAVGDRVGIAWLHSACGACEHCNSGWETLCQKQENTGFSVNGCLAEYAIARASHAIPLPSDLSFEQAAPLLCAGVTSYKAIKETEAMPGQFLTILGAAGGLGHLAIQYAKAMGLRVIAMDVGPKKIQFCHSLGAEFVVDASLQNAPEQVKAITGGGSHGIIVFATHPSAFQNAISMCRPRGTIVCVGLPSGTFDCRIVEVVLNRITIRGSIVGTRQDAKEAIDFANRGLVRCFLEPDTLDNINDVFARLRNGEVEGRVVLNIIDENKI